MAGPQKFHKHPRLPGHEYTHGYYFVTLCTRDRYHWFGRIVGSGADAIMEPNDLGRIILDDWHALPIHFPNIRLDQVQLMPHHLHGIIIINGGSTRRVDAAVGGGEVSARPRGPKQGSLGAIIAAFKSGTTIKMNRLRSTPGQRYWQPGYHDHVIRMTQPGEFNRFVEYAMNNPQKWR